MGLIRAAAAYVSPPPTRPPPPYRLKLHIGCVQRWIGKVSAHYGVSFLQTVSVSDTLGRVTHTHLVVRRDGALVRSYQPVLVDSEYCSVSVSTAHMTRSSWKRIMILLWPAYDIARARYRTPVHQENVLGHFLHTFFLTLILEILKYITKLYSKPSTPVFVSWSIDLLRNATSDLMKYFNISVIIMKSINHSILSRKVREHLDRC